jgi:hypothetical protein
MCIYCLSHFSPLPPIPTLSPPPPHFFLSNFEDTFEPLLERNCENLLEIKLSDSNNFSESIFTPTFSSSSYCFFMIM